MAHEQNSLFSLFKKKTINNNNIFIPKESSLTNIKEFLLERRPKLEEKTFSQYMDELYKDINNFSKGVNLVASHIKEGKKIAILGDYDVDGTVSTSMFHIYFKWLNEKNLNFPHIYHIPNRFTEGYGPSVFAINKFIEEKVNLIITVDNGTSAKKELEMAKKNKIESIVLDHHSIPEETPHIAAFINCQNSSSFKYLSGGGLAFVFIIHLQRALKVLFPNLENFNFHSFTDLVSLSTICDFVPLTGLNRLFVKYGLEKFNNKYESKNKGNQLNPAINIILEYTMYFYNEKSHIRACDLAFMIGPYLNVPGRMADGNLVIKFLSSESNQEREDIFFQLQGLWQNRRKIQEEILQSLEIKEEKSYILVYGNQIHEGIMGITAAQLKEKYNKPAIVISINEEEAKGSIRSIGPFDASELITKGLEENILVKGGGHQMAGGFSIKKEKIKELELLVEVYMNSITIAKNKDIFVDFIVPIRGVGRKFYDLIHSLGPYGVGYLEPNILFPNLIINYIHIINGKHISFSFKNILSTKFIKAMWFSASSIGIETLKKDMIINLIGNMKMTNGKVEIYILDVFL